MRIIAGSARGRRFDAPAGQDTRPTLDRVKESLFGILQFRVRDAEVLDLFSGSGNLGLEAASRGAKNVVCNDRDAACAQLIENNAVRLGLSACVRVLCMDYEAALARLAAEGAYFDIALLDAPYESGFSGQAAGILFRRGLMKENGLAVIEHMSAHPPAVDESVCRIVDTRRYGYAGITFLERCK